MKVFCEVETRPFFSVFVGAGVLKGEKKQDVHR